MVHRSSRSTEPWGTLLVTGSQLDLIPLPTTLWAHHPASVSPSRAYAHPNRGQPAFPRCCCAGQCQRLQLAGLLKDGGEWLGNHILQLPQHPRVQSIQPHGLVSTQLSEQVQNHLTVHYAGPILFPIPIYQRGGCVLRE